MLNDLASIDPRFVYRDARRRYAIFPLGGIGAGGFSITGAGRMVDWSIRNRPELHQFNGYSHFAIKAEQDGKLLKALVLNGPYEGTPTGSPSVRKFDGFGFGANRDSMAGVPHFADVTMVGRFPVAEFAFHDERFPGDVRMQALSPFIPHNDRDSSLPVAMFAFEVENTTAAPIDYTIAGTLGNFGCDSGIHRFVQAGGTSALHLTSADEDRAADQRGDLAIMTDAEDVEHVDYHFRGQWFDSLSLYWREFARAGRMPERHYDKPREVKNMFAQPEHGTLAARITVAPGEKRTIRFAIAWNYPLGSIYWYRRDKPDSRATEGSKPTWKNFYATQWADSLESAGDAFARWDELAGATLAFRDAIFGAALPSEIIDAATGTMGLLRTATVIRLEGGELWGWEGQHEREGSCEGSCTHVWNYQQALASLFPALERSLRDTEWQYNQLPNGGLTFRQRLPLGSGFDIIGPCADGHFGAIIKTFREWRQSGDDAWLAQWWPNIRRALDYAWSPDNPDLWDPEKTGILWGRQHHTLDMELFGPNSWLSSIYVAALKAASEMATAMGEAAFATELGDMAAKGGAYIDQHLFNGRWFAQGLDLSDRAFIQRFDTGRAAGVLADSFMDAYWSDEYSEIKYQIGQGCLTDQILGQWHADIAGIGDILAPEKVTAALKSIFAENNRASLVDHFNPCRVYAYENEGGTLLCSYPEGTHEPAVPAPYAEEVWTGLEYTVASHMIMRGLVEEGLTIVRAARDRHDGSNRSPWNEIECGSYYARSLSSYALVNAWSGLTFDQRSGTIGFAPKGEARGTHFWSAGKGWGKLAVEGDKATLRVLGGELSVGRVVLPFLAGSVTVNGKVAIREGEVVVLPTPASLKAGEALVIQAEG
ncbi:non-lysosomal glucosylceramidase [Mesorhizobium sp. BR1-1-16]|uniref:GH116 family glycosyl-hydrolase n=1 Tax=Mesorhizobium sp. BR1-1-16 TaxID=2876653 RepID=UPI001CD00CFC|nr:GH116 family glycosyl-hydrolase [Mesorhizobium sp. BR1-1-16]MBZ9938348.1 non-lysosomal glucosylceramidase [Mesorhizobium sp. BR1-1-16]